MLKFTFTYGSRTGKFTFTSIFRSCIKIHFCLYLFYLYFKITHNLAVYYEVASQIHFWVKGFIIWDRLELEHFFSLGPQAFTSTTSLALLQIVFESIPTNLFSGRCDGIQNELCKFANSTSFICFIGKFMEAVNNQFSIQYEIAQKFISFLKRHKKLYSNIRTSLIPFSEQGKQKGITYS